MSVIIGDILKVVATMVWTDANIMQNVFNAIITGTGGPYDDDDIVEDALSWLVNMYNGNLTGLSDECQGAQVQVYKYDSGDDDFDEVGNTGWTFAPVGGDHQLPRGVAALTLARTANPDVQGKKYIGGLTEASVTDGLYTAAWLTFFLQFAADWITDFVGSDSGADWNPGVWSPTDSAFYEMGTSIQAAAIPAYQRRRKRGVGA